MQATEIIFEEIERIRMHASAGLSVFQNLDILTGYDLARSHLEAIERALVTIDCAKDLAIPNDIFGSEERVGRKAVGGD